MQFLCWKRGERVLERGPDWCSHYRPPVGCWLVGLFFQAKCSLSCFGLHFCMSHQVVIFLNNVKLWSSCNSIRYNNRGLQSNCRASSELLSVFPCFGLSIFFKWWWVWGSVERKTNFSPHFLDLEEEPDIFLRIPTPLSIPPGLHNAKCLSSYCVLVFLAGGREVCGCLFLCLYLSGVTSLANVDHVSLDYCLKLWFPFTHSSNWPSSCVTTIMAYQACLSTV